MRVLIACEFSGVLRDQFLIRGHDAWSCDLIESESKLNKWLTESRHYVGDVRDILGNSWDLMIAHPPCTYLSVSGARWFKDKDRQIEQEKAIEFVQLLMSAPIPKICIENPIGVISTAIRPPDQIIQPWMFGHGETKSTCLWLKGLPQLQPTAIVSGRDNLIHTMAPSDDRGKMRSISYEGIGQAMASQWGDRDRSRVTSKTTKGLDIDEI